MSRYAYDGTRWMRQPATVDDEAHDSIVGRDAATQSASDLYDALQDAVRTLEAIVNTDGTVPYRYGQSRPLDGKRPPGGERWNTPREIARDALKRLRPVLD